MLFSQLFYSFRNYSNLKNNVPLGRWGKKNQEILLYFGNIDNCGDNICGKGKDIKNYINKYIPSKKDDIFYQTTKEMSVLSTKDPNKKGLSYFIRNTKQGPKKSS